MGGYYRPVGAAMVLFPFPIQGLTPLAIDDHPVGVVGIAVAAPSLLLRGHSFSVKKLLVKLSLSEESYYLNFAPSF